MSLVSLRLSLTTTSSVVTFLDALHCSCGFTVETFQVYQTCALIFSHYSIDFLAHSTLDISIDVALVKTDNVLVLEPSCENEITFTAKVALDVEFSLDEVEHVLWLSVNLTADLIYIGAVCRRLMSGIERYGVLHHQVI